MERLKEYYAFISYKREDKKEAKRLQHALEYYRLPNHLRQENPELPEYVRPVFRDMTDLEVGELSAQIHAGLEQSHFLIVVCSPRAAASKWVNDEVEYFISLGKQDKIISYIIEGVPHASNPQEECYPPALLRLSKEKELLGANINEVGKDSATIRVVSRMFNIRFDTLYQRYQREQKKHRKQLTVAIVFAFLFLAGIAGWIWHQNVLLKEQEWKMMENQSKAVAEKALSLLEEGDSYTARLLALEVLPEDLEKPNRPYVEEAEVVLRKSIFQNTFLYRTTNHIESIDVSFDGSKIAACGRETSEIVIWERYSGKAYMIKTEPACWVKFSPNGRFLASCDEMGHVYLWDVDSMKLQWTSQEGNYSPMFSPDGKILLTWNNTGEICLWDAEERILINKKKAYNSSIYLAQYTQDFKYIVSVGSDNGASSIIKIWDSQTFVLTNCFPVHNNLVYSLEVPTKGEFIVTSSIDKTIKIWDTFSGHLRRTISNDDYSSITLSPDGNELLIGNSVGYERWDIDKGVLMDSVLIPDCRCNRSIKYCPEGKSILIIKEKGIVECPLEIDKEYVLEEYPRYGQGDSIVVFGFIDELNSPNGLRLKELKLDKTEYSTSEKQNMILSIQEDVEMMSKGYKFSVLFEKPDSMIIRTGVIKLSNNKRFLVQEGYKFNNGAYRSYIIIWDVNIGKIINCIEIGETGSHLVYSFSPDDKKIILLKYRSISICDIPSGEIIDYQMANDYYPKAISSDGRWAIFSYSEDIHRIYNINSKVWVYSLYDKKEIPHMDRVWGFSLDSKQIYSLQFKKRIWEFPPLQDLIDQTRERFKDRQLTLEERRKYYLE